MIKLEPDEKKTIGSISRQHFFWGVFPRRVERGTTMGLGLVSILGDM